MSATSAISEQVFSTAGLTMYGWFEPSRANRLILLPGKFPGLENNTRIKNLTEMQQYHLRLQVQQEQREQICINGHIQLEHLYGMSDSVQKNMP